MIEMLLAATLFGSFVWFIIFTVVFLILLFVSEGNYNGVIAFISAIVYGVLVYFLGDINPDLYLPIISWYSAGFYLGIGLLFSLFRTYVHAKKEFKDFNENSSIDLEPPNKKETKEKELLSELKEHVFRWWFLWPVSAIYWVFDELFKDLWNKFYNFAGSLFKKVFSLGFS
jgi:hypothetical protein